jgi:hypothetical protein
VASPLDLAQSFLGTPYLWGGASPGGFDCSGLVQYCYKQFGISLPRTSESQIGVGTPIPVGPPGNELGNALPGDLVFFNNASHEGIVYNPQANVMIDAPHTDAFVRYDKASGFGSVTGIRRVSGIPMAGGPLPTTDTSGTATLVSATVSDCAVSLPLFGCILHKSQFRAVGGGLIMIGGVAIGGLGVWLMAGHPGSEQIGTLAKLAAVA